MNPVRHPPDGGFDALVVASASRRTGASISSIGEQRVDGRTAGVGSKGPRRPAISLGCSP